MEPGAALYIYVYIRRYEEERKWASTTNDAAAVIIIITELVEANSTCGRFCGLYILYTLRDTPDMMIPLSRKSQ